jgi:hypothetical protein
VKLGRLRIGYAHYSSELRRPGDRRRFCFYAGRRGIEFELADPSRDYDLVVLSARADITRWAHYRRPGAKLIYDLIDPYFAVPQTTPKSLGRGLAKYVRRETAKLALNYRAAIERMCERADAVVCTTAEQKADILPFCPNVHVILDYHDHLVTTQKDDYSADAPLKLVWEGLPWNLGDFRAVSPVLREVGRERPLAMHLVTDLEFSPHAGRLVPRRTDRVARKLFDNFYLYQWNEQLLAQIVTACDLALIPLDLDDPFNAGKPENKLLLFWRLGVPALASATPAYKRAMDDAGVSMACADEGAWRDALHTYLGDEAARRDAAQRGLRYTARHHSEEHLLERWDRLVDSL